MILHYFDFTGGAGEPIRNAFKLSGIAFNDARFPMSDWSETKKDTERYIFQQVPVLEVEGAPHAQSAAILRYAGKLSGFYPSEPIMALRVDEIIDCFMEMRGKRSAISLIPDHIKHDAMEGVTNFMHSYYDMIERRIGPDGFTVGDSITIADLIIHNDVTSPFYGAQDIDLQKHPKISKVVANVKDALEKCSTH